MVVRLFLAGNTSSGKSYSDYRYEVYKKILKGGAWVDSTPDAALAEETENAILTQARELYHRDVMTR